MDGKNFKAPSGVIENYFTVDQFGLVCPRQDAIQMSAAGERVGRLLKSKTDLEFRLSERYYLTDVETTDNPYGNTNVIGVGVKKFGARPLKGLKFKGRMDVHGSDPAGVKQQIEKRERRILAECKTVLNVLEEAAPTEVDAKLQTLYEIEHDQALTGGGFDGNKIGDVTLTALKGMIKSRDLPEIANSPVSEYFVQSCDEFRDYLVEHGMALGSLEPDGLSKVRFEQDNDGMLGFPVLKKGGAPLDKDIATRLLIDTGVDTRGFVGTTVHDEYTGEDKQYRIQDAMAYILDHCVISSRDLTSIVVLLARIQKHGWKEENGELVPKPGKARAVFPFSAREACVEGMLINPFNNKLQELKVPCFPSLQDKPTRVDIIKRWMQAYSSDGYGFLAADWSQYDATVPGWGLATIMQRVVKPFFKAQYYNWVDCVTLILSYKFFLIDDSLAAVNNTEYNECLKTVSNLGVGNHWHVFGLKDYLMSGAKFTHVGGSIYGVCSIHLTIPKLIGYKGIVGMQAGDDTLMGVPLSSIHLDSKESTYEPIADAAKQLGLDINPSKQIFYSCNDELVGVFLQDSYCERGDIWGIGSAFRPLAAVFYSERDKHLSVAEQLMAEIARMNNGADNPFVDSAVAYWLSQEQYLGVLFKTYPTSEAFQLIIDAAGGDPEETAKRIDVGSFSFGVGIENLKTGSLPILDVMKRVASEMSFSLNISDVLKSLSADGEEQENNSTDDSELIPIDTEDDE